MPIKLRAKPPYWCHAQSDGKTCNAVLTLTDGRICTPCAVREEQQRKAFFDKPITSAIPGPGEEIAPGIEEKFAQEQKKRAPFWPLNDDGTPCSPPQVVAYG